VDGGGWALNRPGRRYRRTPIILALPVVAHGRHPPRLTLFLTGDSHQIRKAHVGSLRAGGLASNGLTDSRGQRFTDLLQCCLFLDDVAPRFLPERLAGRMRPGQPEARAVGKPINLELALNRRCARTSPGAAAQSSPPAGRPSS
jgi:hypothetical protein